MKTLNLKEYGTKEGTTIETKWFAEEVAKQAGVRANDAIADFLQERADLIEENVKVVTPRPMKVELNQKVVKFEYKNSFLYGILEEAEEAGLI